MQQAETLGLPFVTSDENAPTLLAPTSSFVSAETAIASEAAGSTAFVPPAGAARTTVLPTLRSDGGSVALYHEPQSRYEPIKLLGAGGMGEVVLVEDHDIARRVALKRLLPEMTEPALLARFVDEVRTVGRLEHPNIVPIHDVGVDELGRYYFVMKYVAGETVEAVIEKLRAGDPDYHATYSVERRIQIFLALLQALSYAHDHGVIHRDIKPANIMIGHFGEVLLMDWGIAKPIAESRDPAAGADGQLNEDGRGRTFATHVGSLIGTPAYMSPEQARGENNTLDTRSDLYSAAVVFHELISLRHYLEDRKTLEATLAGVIHEPFGFFRIMSYVHAQQQRMPGEVAHFLAKALNKSPEHRYASAKEMILELDRMLEGRVRVECHITLTKRLFRDFGRLLDRWPSLAFLLFLSILSSLLFSGYAVLHRIAGG